MWARLRRAMLFAKDFQKHVEAAELLLAELPAHPENMLASLDLLLRWAVVRMCDPRANTTCQLKVHFNCWICKERMRLYSGMVRQPTHTTHRRNHGAAACWSISA